MNNALYGLNKLMNWIQEQDKSYIGKKVICFSPYGKFKENDIGEIVGYTTVLGVFQVSKIVITDPSGMPHVAGDSDFISHFKVGRSNDLLNDNYNFIQDVEIKLSQLLQYINYSFPTSLDGGLVDSLLSNIGTYMSERNDK